MTIELNFYSNGVVVKHFDSPTDTELMDAQKGIYSHHYRDGLQFQILDLAHVEAFDISPGTMQMLGLMDYEKAIALGSMFAVVIAPRDGRLQSVIWQAWTNSDDPSETGNTSSASVSPIQTAVVYNMDEAIAWLTKHKIEIPPQQAQQLKSSA